MPTNEGDLNQIDSVIIDRLNCIYSLDCIIAPMIIKSCISRLKADKTDGDIGFNSNHLIHGSQRLCVMLSILFNEMLYHGYYPSDLLKSTIVSIPKKNLRHYLIVTIISVFHCSIVLTNCMIMLLLIYVVTD